MASDIHTFKMVQSRLFIVAQRIRTESASGGGAVRAEDVPGLSPLDVKGGASHPRPEVQMEKKETCSR